MLPVETTLAILSDEVCATIAWTERHGVLAEWIPESLQIRAVFVQPGTEERFFARGLFDGYKARPPEWRFTDSNWNASSQPSLYPLVSKPPFNASMFIKHGSGCVVCAHFNRLAYAGGPHAEWDIHNWVNAAPGYVRGETMPDMLSALYRDFLYSSGRMS